MTDCSRDPGVNLDDTNGPSSATVQYDYSELAPLPFLLSIVYRYASFTIHDGDMSEEKFEDADALKAWLTEQQVPEAFAVQVAHTLFANTYVYPSTLRNITQDQLHELQISGAISNTLFNKLKEPPPQQQDGEFAVALLFLYSCIQMLRYQFAHSAIQYFRTERNSSLSISKLSNSKRTMRPCQYRILRLKSTGRPW
jgi:hypothetical protein